MLIEMVYHGDAEGPVADLAAKAERLAILKRN
jgi:hypothetical protein